MIPPEIDPHVLQAVHEAVIEEKRLKVQYCKPRSEQDQALVLHPHGLIQRGPATYLAALANDYADIRLYALHRIREAEKLDQPSRQLAGFDIAHYAEEQGHFGSGEKIQLVARVAPGLKLILEETKLAEDQVFSGPDEEGWHELRATVRDTWQLRWWVLSQADRVSVVSPDNLGCKGVVMLKTTAAYP